MNQIALQSNNQNNLHQFLYDFKQEMEEEGYLTSDISSLFSQLEQMSKTTSAEDLALYTGNQLVSLLNKETEVLQNLYLVNGSLEHFTFVSNIDYILIKRVYEILKVEYTEELSQDEGSINLRLQAWSIVSRLFSRLQDNQSRNEIKSLVSLVNQNPNEISLIKNRYLIKFY